METSRWSEKVFILHDFSINLSYVLICFFYLIIHLNYTNANSSTKFAVVRVSWLSWKESQQDLNSTKTRMAVIYWIFFFKTVIKPLFQASRYIIDTICCFLCIKVCTLFTYTKLFNDKVASTLHLYLSIITSDSYSCKY